MRNGDNNFKNGHGFEFVSYIYDELDPSARDEFEAHLSTCDDCVMELSSCSDARLGVIEWRREDFDHLETPAVVIPWVTERQTVVSTELEQIGPFTKFLDAVGSLPMFAKAGMGLAAAALLVGVIYFTASQPHGGQIVAGVNEQTEKGVAPAQESKVKEVQSPYTAANEQKESKAKLPAEHTRPQFVAAKSVDRHSSVRRSEFASTRPTSGTSIKKAPRLTTVDEDDDKTLRLADLFAEIGSSEE